MYSRQTRVWLLSYKQHIHYNITRYSIDPLSIVMKKVSLYFIKNFSGPIYDELGSNLKLTVKFTTLIKVAYRQYTVYFERKNLHPPK